MAKKSREQTLIDRYLASGRTLNTVQGNVPFMFLVRPSTTPKVDAIRIANYFEDEIVKQLKEVNLSTPLSGIAIFPWIIDPDMDTLPDTVTYRRGEKSYRIYLNIPYHEWLSATHKRKIELFATNILDSINHIPSKYLSLAERKKLICVVEAVRLRLLTDNN